MTISFNYSCILVCCLSTITIANDQQLLETLTNNINYDQATLSTLTKLVDPKPASRTQVIKKRNDDFPLYKRYPSVEQALPSDQLCQLPTPVYKLEHASKALGIDLYIKRDDLTNPVYGGNKNRTLDFFLADAKRMNASAIVTVGSAGSTHAVATAHAAQQFNFQRCSYRTYPTSQFT